jgi:hypothetical protein
MNPETIESVKTVAAGVVGEALSNPRFSAQAFDATLYNVQQAAVPGSSAMYHYAWAAGLGTVSVSNFMIAWHLPSSHRFLKGVALATGVLSGAAAYLNVQKARTR